MVCDGAHHAILLELARPGHRAIVLIPLSLPRSKRSRNATSTILRIPLVRAHGLCIVGDGVTNRLDVPSKGHPSRVASSCPADSPKGQYEEAKASVCRQKWQDYTRPFPKGLRFAACRSFAGSIETATVGLALQCLFGRRYRTSQGAPWAKCSLPRLSTMTVLPFDASIRTWKHLPCSPSATRWRIGADATIRAIDLTRVATSHEMVSICQNDLGEHDSGEQSPARAAVLSRPGVWGGRSLRDG